MTELIAQGARAQDRWRKKLPSGVWITLGRSAEAWMTPWDERISRQHVRVQVQGHSLRVEVLSQAKNPVFFRGRQVTTATLHPGDHFVIGGTSFYFVDEGESPSGDASTPMVEKTFRRQELQTSQYREASHKLEALSRLPELVASSYNDEELQSRVIALLLRTIAGCQAAGIVHLRGQAHEETAESFMAMGYYDHLPVLTGDHREGPLRPSERLVKVAHERQATVVHLWQASAEREDQPYTLVAPGNSWAFCIPISSRGNEGELLYVTGSVHSGVVAADVEWLHDDVKFAELAAMTLGHAQQARRFVKQQASLATFFSPVVLSALESQDPEKVLAPRETDVTVMFCDLRGFSRESEKSAGNLLELLSRVSAALGVMTKHILAEGGVVGDFHGDSAMGFWGWPLASEQAAAQACRAALAIRREFAETTDGAGKLANFRVGIGLASGRAVAGKIGTSDQVKVTVFGPVVNLAARLEGMTKLLRVPILLDEVTARQAREMLLPDEGRVRKLAKVRPEGMASAVSVSELLLSAEELPLISNVHLAHFEEAVEALERGDWEQAMRNLRMVPPEDLATDFLMMLLAKHNRRAPENWDGVVPVGER